MVRPRECRANSDFDVRQVITADAAYQLPFGKGKMFAGSAPFWAERIHRRLEPQRHSELAHRPGVGTVSNAFVASYSNDAPASSPGPRAMATTHLTKLPGGGVNVFANSQRSRQHL